MTREKLRSIEENLVDQFTAAVGDPESDLVSGFKDGVEHMTKALIESGALKVEG